MEFTRSLRSKKQCLMRRAAARETTGPGRCDGVNGANRHLAQAFRSNPFVVIWEKDFDYAPCIVLSPAAHLVCDLRYGRKPLALVKNRVSFHLSLYELSEMLRAEACSIWKKQRPPHYAAATISARSFQK